MGRVDANSFHDRGGKFTDSGSAVDGGTFSLTGLEEKLTGKKPKAKDYREIAAEEA